MDTAQALRIRANGERFEIAVMNKIKPGALFCQRTAGSYGQADVMAVMRTGTTRLIQCKANGYLCPKERRQLAKLLAKLPPNVQLEVFYRPTPRTMSKRIITRVEHLEVFATQQGVSC